MSATTDDPVRSATADDADELLTLWTSVYDDAADPSPSWVEPARAWFVRSVEDPTRAVFPVIRVDGHIVATAIGTLELGVPNPHSRRGRAVRLANVVTSPDHRRQGYGTLLVEHVSEWARSIDADRVDLSATPEGLRIYERAGFTLARAPRMKLVL